MNLIYDYLFNYFGWDSYSHGEGRNILGNHGIGTDDTALTDAHATHDTHIITQPYVVTNDDRTFIG